MNIDRYIKNWTFKKYYIKKKIFSSESSVVKAIDDITFSIKKGEVFVLAGESGSGKSTIIKLILKSIQADEGKIIFENQEIDNQKKIWIKLEWIAKWFNRILMIQLILECKLKI